MPFSTPSLFDDSTRDLGADTDPAVPSKMPHTQRMRPPMETVLPPLPMVPTPTAFLSIAPPPPRLVVETPSVGPTVLSPPPTPEPFASPPRPGRTPVLLVAATATILAGIAMGGLLGLRERLSTHATAEVKARAAPPPPAAPPAAPASASASASASAPALSPTTGRLLTDPAEQGHRIFLDGRVAGTGGAALTVRCGKHDVRVGSGGHLRRVDIPCGGDVHVAR